ncbi:GHKL domain-containing protein [uncultured Senegalimassilia sp.]|uniref:sensor histidine kinase n=1 Tax=uncultured Senegalimassilia sp. TaxID=1714350 RepID=UPI0025EDAB39|nr:GHKL domain-containing protein [uncultured Senegalimassilia sp.]
MSSLKIAVLCVLAAYLLIVAFNFITKLRGARLMQKLLCMLFPLSQICLIAYPLACSAGYELPAGVYTTLVVLGIACGPVDLLLFRVLDQACRWFDSSNNVRMLQEQLQVQSALRQRSRRERDQVDELRDQLRERFEQARADLRADQAGKAGESLEEAVSLIGTRSPRLCQHPAVDALLEQKARTARDLGVRFRAELDIPADIKLPSVELCAVFSNLLDNALNACVESPEGDLRVEATARLWGMYLVVDVENSCPRSKGQGEGSGRPPLGDAARPGDGGGASGSFPDLSVPHGWGQGIVREVARRHDGTFEAGQVDGVYRVRVILKQDRAAQDGGDGEWSR